MASLRHVDWDFRTAFDHKATFWGLWLSCWMLYLDINSLYLNAISALDKVTFYRQINDLMYIVHRYFCFVLKCGFTSISNAVSLL